MAASRTLGCASARDRPTAEAADQTGILEKIAEVCISKKEEEWGDELLPLTKTPAAKLVLETTKKYNNAKKVFELDRGVSGYEVHNKR